MSEIKSLRAACGLTQQDLSEKSRVKLSTLQKLEQGKANLRRADAETVYNLARALHTTVEHLLETSDP